jgi:hypothetical protein
MEFSKLLLILVMRVSGGWVRPQVRPPHPEDACPNHRTFAIITSQQRRRLALEQQPRPNSLMKNQLSLSLVALVVSGLALGSVLFDSGRPTELSKDGEAVEQRAISQSVDLTSEIEALQADNRALIDRIKVLELRPASTVRESADKELVTLEEFRLFQEEVEKALRARSGAAEVNDPVSPEFKETIADTLAQIKQEEAVENVRAYQEKRLGRLEGTMVKLDGWLQLAPNQSSEMRRALMDQYDREAEVLRRWESGEGNELIGELKSTNRQALRDDLSGFLSEEQLTRYMSRPGK